MSNKAPNHTERTHHKYGMSKLNALDFCGGYRSKDEPSEASEEGTRLHEIMDRVAGRLKLRLAQKKPLDAVQELQDLLEGGDVFADEDQRYYLEFCCKELNVWLAKKPVRIENEIRVYINHPNGTELNHGHLDILIVFRNDVAALIDYKFGWIPVPPAIQNLQGLGYAAGCFQKFPALKKICSVFTQPKLHVTTRHLFDRSESFSMYQRVRGVIDNAERADKILRPGPYCDFCESLGTCTALVKSAHAAVVKYEGLPLPDIFDGAKIQTAEQAAVALYCVERLEALIENGGIKAKALEFAKAAGGRLEVPIGDGTNVVLEVRGRKAARSANSPALIAEALKDVLAPEQVLGCCDPSITKLEEVFADTLVEQRKKEAAEYLATAEREAAEADLSGHTVAAKTIRAEAKRIAKEIRVTKKAAYEIMADTLRSEGLLSAPAHLIEFLKVRLEKNITPTPAAEITNQ